ncbi:hypothetical protein K9M74_00775 [Candidatus Woesearchaeota archaeon]|nr:hypothetical protein [Candidatus Woesearchaeota archaeon]
MKYPISLIIIATLFLAACTTTPEIILYGTNTQTTQETNTKMQTTTLDEFAQCLTDNDATFYGAYWCSHCSNQKKTFGDAMKYVNYVECEEEKQQCINAQITAYPTWIIQGEQYLGGQTLERLSALTGCKLPARN